MLGYIYDYLSILFDKIDDKSIIKSIILFGSVARGNARKDSDIDLFIDVSQQNKDEVNAKTKEALNEFEVKAKKTWKLRGVANPISIIVDDLKAEKWKELKIEMSTHGIVLYSRYMAELEVKKNAVLLEYDLSKAKQKVKMKVLRNLFGYSIKRGKKLYSWDGILHKVSGEKLSNGVIVPMESFKEVRDIFAAHKIPLKLREIAIK